MRGSIQKSVELSSARSTCKGSRIARLSETSNAEAHADMMYLFHKNNMAQWVSYHRWTSTVALSLDNRYEFARFLHVKNKASK